MCLGVGAMSWVLRSLTAYVPLSIIGFNLPCSIIEVTASFFSRGGRGRGRGDEMEGIIDG